MFLKPRNKWKNLVLAALALMPCGVVSSVVPAVAEQAKVTQVTVLPFETLGLGNHSGAEKRALMTIDDAAEWQRVWGVHTQHESDAPELPKVDFSRQTVIALLGGLQPDAKTIQAAQVVRTATETVVFYLLTNEEAAPGETVTPGPSAPFHFALVDKITLPVRFADAFLGELDCQKCGG